MKRMHARTNESPRNANRVLRVAKRARLARLFLATVGLFALLPAAEPAGAQTSDDLLRELERTDRVIERARDVVSESQSPLAVEYLEQAVKLQNLAKSTYRESRLADAARLTRTARERAFTAVRIAEQAGSAEFILFMMERTEAIIDRVAPIVRGADSEPAHRLLDASLEHQRRSREVLRAGQPRAALSLTYLARDRALRALRRAESGEARMPERAGRVLERTDGLLDDSAWLLGAGDDAAEEYGRAIRIQEQAKVLLVEGDFQSALRLSMQSRERLVRALGRAERPIAAEAVERVLERSRTRLERARQRAESESETKAVERATRHLRRAEVHFEHERLAACMAEVRALESALDRAGL